MKINLKNNVGEIFFAGDYRTHREAVQAAFDQGVSLVNADLSYLKLAGIRLPDANLTNANLIGADLIGADLTGANLTGADLIGANLTNANLIGADLTVADLTVAELIVANLTDANLTDANLTDANLTGADLTGAEIAGAHLTGTRLTEIQWGFPVNDRLPAQIAAIVLDHPDTLDMQVWHECSTTHCLAGWAIQLSGERGAALEAEFGPALAGALLMPSANHLFHAGRGDALRWLRTHARGTE